MIDPVSITASTITILGLLKVVKESTEILKELRDAPVIILDLNNELSEFQLCLERLQQLSEADLTDNSFHQHLQNLMRRCATAVEETLDLTRGFRKSRYFSVRNAERLGWRFNRRTVRAHEQRLLKLRLELLLILSSTITSQTIKTRVVVERIETTTQQLSQQVQTLDANVSASKQEIVQRVDQTLSVLGGRCSHGFQGSSQTDTVRVDVSTKLRVQVCGPYCDCPCHRDRFVALQQTPHWLDQFIGSLFLGYSATPDDTPQCITSCSGRASMKRIRLSYFFPAWCYWRAIRAALILSDTGPEFVVRMPKAVPTDWKLFGRAFNNEFVTLRQLLKTKQAAPTDTDAFTGMTALHQAASSGAIESCQDLLHAGADPHAEDKSRQTPYLLAWSHILSNDISDQKIGKLRELFTDSYLDEWELSTLHRIVLGLIVRTLNTETLAWSGSDINAIDCQGRTALFWAAARKDMEKADFLLRHGADATIKSFDGQTAVHAAARSGSEQMVHLLLDYGANIHVVDKHNKLPLHVAVTRKWDIEYLLQLGSEISATDCYSRPAMWYAAEKDSFDNVQALIHRNADINPQDNMGWSPLHVCVERNQHLMADLLIAHGADMTLLTNDGRNVLHFAAEFANVETLKMLSQSPLKGIDPRAKSVDGFTPQQIAARRRVAGLALAEHWDRGFAALIEKVISSNANRTEDTLENGEEVFFDAHESISSTVETTILYLQPSQWLRTLSVLPAFEDCDIKHCILEPSRYGQPSASASVPLLNKTPKPRAAVTRPLIHYRAFSISSSSSAAQAVPQASSTYMPSAAAEPPAKPPQSSQPPKSNAPEPKTLPASAKLAAEVHKRAPFITETYIAYGVCEKLVKECASQADYTIPQRYEKDGVIPKTADGQDLGVGKGWWYESLGLTPTFNNWAQVTFLHMYILTVRLRAFPPFAAPSWHQHLLDHFFYAAEDRMVREHNVYSRMIRNKYLKDFFTQWRGVLAAYDEGLVKGDAVLATAVWRNIFHGREDVDLKGLGEVVCYMRGVLKGLEAMEDTELARGEVVFGDPGTQAKFVEVRSGMMDTLPEEDDVVSKN
ncbi:MAG: hypothetical protein Q9208_002314 [Pyrenodesmia sp. 3 TL-2023]